MPTSTSSTTSDSPADAAPGADPTAGRPRNAVVVLLDSLNRHHLGGYGGNEFETPNLDRFARRSVRFDQHYAGSLPCMPARHDMLTGALDFLWRPWGSIEVWEEPVTVPLRRAGVTTKLVTDHPHLFETGGENYHCDFTAWDYQRGHESDLWRTRPDPSWTGAPSFGRGHTPYDDSRGWFAGEPDFPGPRVMREAARWLEDEAPHHDRFFLFVDEFDPHEPFDTPEPYASMYDDSWEGPHLVWPPYVVGAAERGVLDDRKAHQVRSQYGGKLTMIDRWFGDLLDTLERTGRLDDTAVIVCTDHGHYLGDLDPWGRDIWGKPGCPIYEPLGHTPLLVHWPGVEPGRATPSRPTSTCTRRSATSSGCAASTARTASRSSPSWRRRCRLSASTRSPVSGDARCTSSPIMRSTPAPPQGRTSRSRCGRTAGRRCRCTPTRTSASPSPTTGRASTGCPGARSRC